MKKIAVLMAFVIIFIFSGCKEEKQLTVIEDDNPVKFTEISLPYFSEAAILRSFDGKYACFTAQKAGSSAEGENPMPQTVQILVYDTENQTVETDWQADSYIGCVMDAEYKDGSIYYVSADYESGTQTVNIYNDGKITEVYSLPYEPISSRFIDLIKDKNNNILFIYKDKEYNMKIGIAREEKREIMYNISGDSEYSVYNLIADGKNKNGLYNAQFNTVNYANSTFYIDRWNADKIETVRLVPLFSRFFTITGDNAFYYEISDTDKGKEILLTGESLTNETTAVVRNLGKATIFKHWNGDEYMIYLLKDNDKYSFKAVKSEEMQITARDVDFDFSTDNVTVCIAKDKALLAEEYEFGETSGLYIADLS